MESEFGFFGSALDSFYRLLLLLLKEDLLITRLEKLPRIKFCRNIGARFKRSIFNSVF